MSAEPWEPAVPDEIPRIENEEEQLTRVTLIKDVGNQHTLAEYAGELDLHEALRRYADDVGADSYVMVPSTWGPRMRVDGRVVRATYSPLNGVK